MELSQANREGLATDELFDLDPHRDQPLEGWVRGDLEHGEFNQLFLHGVTELSVDQAAVLADYRGHRIFLPDLEHLTPEAAEALAGFPSGLFLHGLTQLDAPTAARLATWRGNGEQLLLSLNGLRELTPDVAAALTPCRGWGIALNGLTDLTPEAATALQPLRCAFLDLDGLTHLAPATVEAMTSWGVKFLGMGGWLDPEPKDLERLEAAGLLLRR